MWKLLKEVPGNNKRAHEKEELVPQLQRGDKGGGCEVAGIHRRKEWNPLSGILHLL